MRLLTVSNEQKAELNKGKANEIGQVPLNAAQKSEHQKPDLVEDLRLHRFECRGCGYIYDPKEGLGKYQIPKGTAFLDIDRQSFRCPVCRAGFDAYKDIGAQFQPIEGF